MAELKEIEMKHLLQFSTKGEDGRTRSVFIKDTCTRLNIELKVILFNIKEPSNKVCHYQ